MAHAGSRFTVESPKQTETRLHIHTGITQTHTYTCAHRDTHLSSWVATGGLWEASTYSTTHTPKHWPPDHISANKVFSPLTQILAPALVRYIFGTGRSKQACWPQHNWLCLHTQGCTLARGGQSRGHELFFFFFFRLLCCLQLPWSKQNHPTQHFSEVLWLTQVSLCPCCHGIRVWLNSWWSSCVVV